MSTSNSPTAHRGTLRRRLIILFAAMAMIPTVVLALFAMVYFHYGVDAWFSSRINTALDQSQTVADAYLYEHKNVIRADALAMASDLNRQSSVLAVDQLTLMQTLKAQLLLRSLSQAILLDGQLNIIAQTGVSTFLQTPNDIGNPAITYNYLLAPVTEKLSPRLLRRASSKGIVTLEEEDRIAALVPLDRYVDSYLFVSRRIDPLALQAGEGAAAAVESFRSAENKRQDLKKLLTSGFLGVALLLLLAAVYVAMRLARSITRPVVNLVEASRKVREGDLSAIAKVSNRKDELRTLTVAFNRMTRQLNRQRRDLLVTNNQLAERHRFIETVLAGVSAGVISLDAKGHIRLYNDAAGALLSNAGGSQDYINIPLENFLPITKEMMAKAPMQQRWQQKNRTLLLQMRVERLQGRVVGYVLTFDDVTELLRAQKLADWADVAKRLAHEIKNPLTPIQLSAERLQRKYAPQIVDDAATFERLVATIIRQVEDMQHLLDEFSAFARMPKAQPKIQDVRGLMQDGAILARQGFIPGEGQQQINIDLDIPVHPVMAAIDAPLLRQALMNIMKNAVEAGADHLIVGLTPEMTITVIDNGAGLPDDHAELIEPYVTTKAKGTGLGLAVVKKIVEEHNGTLIIGNNIADVAERAQEENGNVKGKEVPEKHNSSLTGAKITVMLSKCLVSNTDASPLGANTATSALTSTTTN